MFPLCLKTLFHFENRQVFLAHPLHLSSTSFPIHGHIISHPVAIVVDEVSLKDLRTRSSMKIIVQVTFLYTSTLNLILYV